MAAKSWISWLIDNFLFTFDDDDVRPLPLLLLPLLCWVVPQRGAAAQLRLIPAAIVRPAAAVIHSLHCHYRWCVAAATGANAAMS